MTSIPNITADSIHCVDLISESYEFELKKHFFNYMYVIRYMVMNDCINSNTDIAFVHVI